MTQDVENLTQINWVQTMAKDYLKQKRRQRYAKWGLRSVLLLLVVIGIIFSPSGSSDGDAKKKHVAVIELEGGIFAKSHANSERFINALDSAFKNKSAEVIMININSPGGSPVQADEMYQALMTQRKANPKKKVIAICAEMCASAAYYVAAGADEIIANPSSLVGSIGVISNGFGFTGAMDKIGISRRMVTAGKNKGFLDPFSPMESKDKEKLQVMLNIIHDEFKNNVIAGRGKRLKITEETFSGLFWTGRQAKERGLIDGFGSSRDGYKELPRIVYSHKDSVLDQISKQLSESVSHEIFAFLSAPKFLS